MKKKYKMFLFIVIIIILAFFYLKYTYTFEFSGGESFKRPVQSPSGKYTANAYYKTYGGAAGGVNLWVEITYNEGENIVRTVYYADAKSYFTMEWIDETTIYITNEEHKYPNENRSIKLQIGKEIYDESGAACSSWVIKDEYETCHQG